MLPSFVPDAPWQLCGAAFAVFCPSCSIRLLVSYSHSPVGAYDEHALATLIFQNGVLAPHVWQMSVNSEASKIGGRAIWGFPKTLENLGWHAKNNRFEFSREGRKLRIRGFGPTFPLQMSFFTLQNRDGVWLQVPGRLEALARLGFRGRQIGLILPTFSLKIAAPESV